MPGGSNLAHLRMLRANRSLVFQQAFKNANCRRRIWPSPGAINLLARQNLRADPLMSDPDPLGHDIVRRPVRKIAESLPANRRIRAQ
jgi:hypothetical protein